MNKGKPGMILAVALAAVGLGGCASMLVAGGAVAGYAASRDSATVDLDRSWDWAWEAARAETMRLGSLKREDPRRGRLDARVDGADVVVTLKQLTSSTVRVTIRARKNLLPRLAVAQKLGLAILHRA